MPRLFVRVGDEPWQNALPPPKWRWFNLFLNPMGSYHHALCNALDHLLEHPDDPRALQIIDRHCKNVRPGLSYEFKITTAEGEVVLSRQGRL